LLGKEKSKQKGKLNRKNEGSSPEVEARRRGKQSAGPKKRRMGDVFLTLEGDAKQV